MSTVAIDSTGCIVIDGQKVFPIGLSEAPPLGGKTPDGRDAWAEVASAGANFVRSGFRDWSLAQIDSQIATERGRMDAAAAHGMYCWPRLGNAGDLPTATGGQPSVPEQLLVRIANGLKTHPALGAYKGVDEPAWGGVAPAGLTRARTKLRTIDPDHPVVITQAPLGSVASLVPYRPAFDITGADIYPVAYPPGQHSDLPNKDISVVGDVTKKMVDAAGGKPVWMTLQIAWSGITPNQQRPGLVPRFPALQEERFMAYQAIVDGARGLVFFGGQLTQVMRPRDAQLGWNWTFWELVLRPLLVELTSPSILPALIAPVAQTAVTASAAGMELTARRSGNFLYVIAVRRGGTTSRVTFSGLPPKQGGGQLAVGQAMFEYAQDPLPPPIQPDIQQFRYVQVQNGSFKDWFGPHDVHVYRFNLA
ncbi:MAG: hypothetical protein E6G18_10170 [Actinobacteria bacterium]|nr:MAG: hypothetical protein E6G18_10170 [Actinomycetota bacterium]